MRSTFLFALTLSTAALLAAQDAAAPPKGTVEKITVHGKSLEGSLEGDSADRAVFVYLPPSYAGAPNRRYPVVYLLHGYGLTGERWMGFARVQDGADKAFAAGAREMILVSPDAYTLYNGSMYSNSATTGFWEDFIAEDLVAYVDSHYRTVADRMSRGLAGHSMGGYGTLRIGMKRPDVFSSLYPMSSCCLSANIAPNPQQMAAYDALKTPEEAKAGAGRGGRGGGGGGISLTTLASAAAWSPNPQNPPFYFDLPVKGGEVQPAIVAKWAANAPLAMLEQYIPNLKKYTAIGMEVGEQDNLIGTNRQMEELLTRNGVAHTFETYVGDHNNKVAERMETRLVPFFSKNLK